MTTVSVPSSDPPPSDSPALRPEPIPSWPGGALVCLDLLLAAFVFGAIWEVMNVLPRGLGYKILFYAMWLLIPPLNAMWLMWRLIFLSRDLAQEPARHSSSWNGMGASRVLLNRVGGHALSVSLPALLSWGLIMGRGWDVIPGDSHFRFVWEGLIYSAATFICLMIALLGSARLLERACRGTWGWFASLSAFSVWSAWAVLAFYGIAITMVPIWLMAKWHLWLGYVTTAAVTVPMLIIVAMRLCARWRILTACYPLGSNDKSSSA